MFNGQSGNPVLSDWQAVRRRQSLVPLGGCPVSGSVSGNTGLLRLPDHFMIVILPSTAESSSDEVVRNSSYTEKSLVTTIRAFAFLRTSSTGIPKFFSKLL